MSETDLPEFTATLDDVCGLLSRGSYAPSPRNTALWFRALADHDIAAVRAGFDAHVKDALRGRFVPTPADIRAQIEGAAGNDGRPGADEAWALAIAGRDEATTVVWTGEMAEAWGIALPVLHAGDEVGARVAFRDAYNRLVDAARKARSNPEWSASLGFDVAQRDRAIAEAVERNRLPRSALASLPPAVRVLELPRWTGGGSAQQAHRERLQQIADRLRQKVPAGPSQAEIDVAHTADLKRASRERLAEYDRQHGEKNAATA